MAALANRSNFAALPVRVAMRSAAEDSGDSGDAPD
jgi:hypothetical protein